jgi:hypothetical protein
VTRDEAWNLANHWVAAWNAHDLDLIMTHYDDAIELTSPVAAQLLGTAGWQSSRKGILESLFSARARSLPGTPLSRSGRALGPKQRGVLLHESKGNTYRRVHGVVSDRKSDKSRSALQCLTTGSVAFGRQIPTPE